MGRVSRGNAVGVRPLNSVVSRRSAGFVNHSGYAILPSWLGPSPSSTTAWRRKFSLCRRDFLRDSSDTRNEWRCSAQTSECRTPGSMGGGLFELRIKAAEGIARVFYCTVIDRRIVVLHQFVKKTDKTPPKELEIARRRMKDLT